MCESGIQWIYDGFGDCIVTTTDKVSFATGLFSSVCWTISSIPQVYTICKTKSVDGISPFLFSFLFIGDLMSLIGTIINNGLVTQILNYTLYVCLDLILLALYLYHKCFKKYCNHTFESFSSKGFNNPNEINLNGLATVLVTNVVAAAVTATNVDYSLPYTGKYLVGTLFGWCSAIICITSRIPQVLLDFKRKFVTNLSPYFFACTIVGNSSYFLSILIRDQSPQFMWRQAPWICECLGPLSCDIITAIQMCVYGYSTTNYYKEEDDIGEISSEEDTNDQQIMRDL